MLHTNFWKNWPDATLSSPHLGACYLPHLCESFVNGIKSGLMVSKLEYVRASLELLHAGKDMCLLQVKLLPKEGDWVLTRWVQNEDKCLGENEPISSHPCLIVLHFNKGTSVSGFYRSHLRAKASKRKADGTRNRYPHKLQSLVMACPKHPYSETFVPRESF